MTLKRFRFTVTVESNEGHEFIHSIDRFFTNSNKARGYLRGFEDGAAVAYDGAVISSELEDLDQTLEQTIANNRVLRQRC